jgi:lysophospholipase L1-like esterase
MDRACFEVKAVSFDAVAAANGDVSCFTAEQYLAWVVQQASSLPDVVRIHTISNNDITQSVDMQANEASAHKLDLLLPSPEWDSEFMSRFRALRQVIVQLIITLENFGNVID